MRTKHKTRVSFSDNTLNVNIPHCWRDLSQQELTTVYRIKASCHEDSVPLLTFAAITGMKVLRRCDEDYAYTCRWKTSAGKKTVRVEPDLLAEMIAPLDFLKSPGADPVRLERMGKAYAIDAQLHGVPFHVYLKLENLYQAVLSATEKDSIILEIARLLYPGFRKSSLKGFEKINVLNWAVQIKNMFALQFSHFFQPAASGASSPSMLDVMNCEIRALTGGDISKEPIILEADCWRALTELDFLAKETEESRRKLKKQ